MPKPYNLAWADNWLCVSGPTTLLKDLLRIPGAVKMEWGVAIPESRSVYLAVEALAAPAQVSADYRAARVRMMMLDKAQVDNVFTELLVGAKLSTPLLPHQLDTVAFVREGRGALIGSEPGTGKSRCALALAYLWKAQRVLVVCPLSVIPTWKREWELLWLPPRPFAMSTLDSVSVQERRTRLIAYAVNPEVAPIINCINYEVIADLTDAIREYNSDVIILDESSRVKNNKAKVTKALIPLCDAAKHVLALNGTPYANNGAADLWAQLRMLGPEVVSESYWQFASSYCNLDLLEVGGRQIWRAQGCRDPIGLMTRLEPVYFRVTREAVMTLPPTQRITVELEMTKEQRALYNAVVDDGVGVLGDPLSLEGARVAHIRLHQICGGNEPFYNPDDPESNGSGYRLVPFEDEPKLDWLLAYADEVLLPNPSIRVIIWFRYTMELFRIVEALQECIGEAHVKSIWGQTTNEEIEQIKESFNSLDPEGVQVMCCQVQKMSFGHNLSACQVALYFSNGWSHLQRVQSEDRARRIGSKGGLTIFDLVCKDSIDIDIKKALDSHQDFSTRLSPSTVGVL